MANLSSHQIVLVFLIGLYTLTGIAGHGFVGCPTGRSYLSKSGVLYELIPADKPDMPANWTNAINCGNRIGSNVGIPQYDFPATEFCGPCGDQIPLAGGPVHEYQKKYDRGIIGGRFLQGDIATFTVTLDNLHWGYMEFRLCPDVTRESQDCMNENLLQIMNPSPGSDGSYQYYVNSGSRPRCSWDPTNVNCTMSQVYNIQVKLPDNISTERGVIQWNYITGRDSNGGPDFECKYPTCTAWEIFRGCADIRIDPYITLLQSSYVNDKTKSCMTATGIAGVLGAGACNPNDIQQIIMPRQPWQDYDHNPFYIGFYDSGCATTCMDVFTQPMGENAVIAAYTCKCGLADWKTTKASQIWKTIPVAEGISGNWINGQRAFTEDQTFLIQQGSQWVKNLCATVYEVAGLLRIRLNSCNPNNPNQRWTLAKYAIQFTSGAGK